jgi:hypothetical protein
LKRKAVRYYRSFVSNAVGAFAALCVALVAASYIGRGGSDIIPWAVCSLFLFGAARCMAMGVKVQTQGVKYRGFFRTRVIPWAEIAQVDLDEIDHKAFAAVVAPVLTMTDSTAVDGEPETLTLRAVASYAWPGWEQRTVAWRAYLALREGFDSARRPSE